jgi:hypothetical protein
MTIVTVFRDPALVCVFVCMWQSVYVWPAPCPPAGVLVCVADLSQALAGASPGNVLRAPSPLEDLPRVPQAASHSTTQHRRLDRARHPLLHRPVGW